MGFFSLWSLISASRLPTSDFRLPTSDFRLPTIGAAILRIAGIPAKLHAKYFWENTSLLAAVFFGQQHLSYQGEYFV